MFFEMQPMQQVTKKCSQNRPKGSKNRAQDAQDAAKMASWSHMGAPIKQYLHTPSTLLKQYCFTGTVAGDAKHLG